MFSYTFVAEYNEDVSETFFDMFNVPDKTNITDTYSYMFVAHHKMNISEMLFSVFSAPSSPIIGWAWCLIPAR